MDPLLLLLILFTTITIVLFKTKYERHFLFFMVRTQHGIRLIDFLAGIRPRLWKFIGDLGIVLSFSGLGALYLSKKKESRGNLYYIIVLISLLAVSVSKAGILPKLSSVLLLAIAVLIMRKIDNTTINFIVTSLLISSAARAFIPKIHFVLLLGFLGFPALIIMALVQQAYDILQGSMLPGISPLIPSTRGGNIGVTFPGYDIFIPWWYALIAIIATLVPHELAHGVLSKVHHVKVKSTGLLTFGALPLGAFVEPDEENLKSKSSISRTRVYAVGSLANFAVGILCILSLTSITVALDYLVLSDGVKVIGFDKGYPAEKTLKEGMVIYQFNNKSLYGLKSFEDMAKSIKPGENITLNTDNGVLMLEAAQNPLYKERGYMGVVVRDNIKVRYGFLAWLITPNLLSFVVNSLSWIFFFSISIGLVNLLPVPPFDGYRVFDEIIKTTSMKKKNIRRVIYGVIIATAVIFFLNIFPLIKMVLNPVLEYFGF